MGLPFDAKGDGSLPPAIRCLSEHDQHGEREQGHSERVEGAGPHARELAMH